MLFVVEDMQMENAKTKEFYSLLQKWELEKKKITLLLSEKKENVARSSRNIPNVNVYLATDASTYDLLNSEILLLEKSALDKLQEVFKS